MFENILKYGKLLKDERYLETPEDILREFNGVSTAVPFLKRDLYNMKAEPVERCETLTQAHEKVCNAESEIQLVMYTLVFIALKNPIVKTKILEGVLYGYY